MLSRIFNPIYDFFKNLLAAGIRYLTQAFTWLLEKLFAFLKVLLMPFLIVIAIIFYFVFKLGQLVVTLITVLLAIGKLFYSLVQGLIKTLAGFTFTTTNAPDHGSWSSAMSQAFDGLASYQLDKLAYVLLFMVWIMTAYAAIKVLSSRGAD